MTKAMGGEQRTYETAGRLALGLGNPNAGDIGFSFDHRMGIPVIPGSSFKGLVGAGARLLGEEAASLLLLGEGPSADDENPGRSGRLTFLDTFPDNASWQDGVFEIDIITCHHSNEKLSRQKTPIDADDPTPVHFLVVKKGVRFVFRIAPLLNASQHDMSDAWRWLEAGLTLLGAGGKTAVGYGEMKATDVGRAKPVVGERKSPTPDNSLDTARRLAEQVSKSNAAQTVQPLLNALQTAAPSEARTVAQRVVKKLTKRWVQARQQKKAWAHDLLNLANH